MKDLNKETHIAEEAFVIQHSGEIPEVTLYESLYYLTEDPDGPALKIDKKDVLPLKQAVVKRYRAIILRDLDAQNRDKRIFRGLARCAANWQRLQIFCIRESIDCSAIRYEAAEALQAFLHQEAADVESEKRSSCINCSQREVENLAGSLGVAMADLPKGWQELCPD